MKTLYRHYVANFQGLSKEIWLLSLVTFINRAGAMVIPFLSLYLVSEKGFSLPQVGWIMTGYGLGSLLGNWMGGKLTDRIGFYKTIVISLFLGGLGFISIQFIDSFEGLVIGLFGLMWAVDLYRPGIFVAADVYSKKENLTRSIGLIRLAINLGFSIGPVIGGILIAHVSYNSIFWIDGGSCLLASALLFVLLKPKKRDQNEEKEKVKAGKPPYRNSLYMLFLLIMVINSLVFVQYFSTVPLYYQEDRGLSEDVIGWLLFLNGAMIVLLEMPLIGWLERLGLTKTGAMIWGILFLAASFLVLNFSSGFWILIVGMILMTLGEMIGSPFSNALAIALSPEGRKGSYMGLYSMSWSLSHIIGHNGGMNLIDQFGFANTWYIFFALLIVAVGLSIYLLRQLRKKDNFDSY
ncbi:MDR family MFS transporter [Aureitalea marina]|uniref:MFS transporter n=1 Tax=Aureitalea marina TaxID=930804 RepID=A0A2S7KMJ4_9FLAO|nr:MFS transporter [Aureitalea marina]PQB03821.1 MFS transporter [Aureitalea marina]